MTKGKKGKDSDTSVRDLFEVMLTTPMGKAFLGDIEKELAEVLAPVMTSPQAETAWAIGNAFEHSWTKVWTAEKAVSVPYEDLMLETLHATLQQQYPLFVIPDAETDDQVFLLAYQAIGEDKVDETLALIRRDFKFLRPPHHDVIRGREEPAGHKWLVYPNGNCAIYVRRGHSAIATYKRRDTLKVMVGSQLHAKLDGVEYAFTQDVDADAEKGLTPTEWETQGMLMTALGYAPAKVEIQLSTGKTTLADILGMA
jgi:hypothetical protein